MFKGGKVKSEKRGGKSVRRGKKKKRKSIMGQKEKFILKENWESKRKIEKGGWKER